jgi:uncharacterized membrane protein
MQSEAISQILPVVNLLVTTISVVGIVHILQERFTQPQELKKANPFLYYSLRGGLTGLAAIQLAALLSPVSIPLLLTNLCTATISTITSKYFN